jgi:hypothetical protein
MSKTETQKVLVQAMKSSKGRFFGLYLKNGDCINAQFRSETPKTVVVYDRNRKTTQRVYKESIAGLNM